jgi:AraC family transcriptional regulator of adaptative response / DNA-3-methyladenine glycosylase II
VIDFLGVRAVAGVEEAIPGGYRRSLVLPRGAGVVELCPRDDHVRTTLFLDDPRDREPAIDGCRRLLDLDSDPAAVFAHLSADPVIGALVRAVPGRRVPGHPEGGELAVRAVLGQQVSVAAATKLAGRLVAGYGRPLSRPVGAVTRLFPAAASIAAIDPARLGMPRARARTVTMIAGAVDRGELRLEPAADHAATFATLLALPGIGPWTAGYIAMRALHDPDAFTPGDAGLRQGLRRLGHDAGADSVGRLSEGWRPYRAYAIQYLWALAAAGR